MLSESKDLEMTRNKSLSNNNPHELFTALMQSHNKVERRSTVKNKRGRIDSLNP